MYLFPNLLSRFTSIFILVLFVYTACNPSKPKEVDIIKNPTLLRKAITNNIKERVTYFQNSNDKKEGLINKDALLLFYKGFSFNSVWCDSSEWLSITDSLLNLLVTAPDNGIDTQFIHLNKIKSLIIKTKTDTTSAKDAALFARIDILLTDAYFSYANRICFSQLSPDSIRIRKQKIFSDSVLYKMLSIGIKSKNLFQPIYQFEPIHPQYLNIKVALKNYRMDFLNVHFTKVPDTLSLSSEFKNILKIRLLESCDFDSSLKKSDSLKLALAIKSFQKKHGLFPDGVPGKRTLKAMNVSPEERIGQINYTLDQWRAEPDTFPNRYIYVNLPSFSLEYWVNDTLRLESKIICGSPNHNSPILNSKINYLVLYPYWTVPFSIATKEILPHLKNDTSYLRKQNMEVLNSSRQVIDAKKINWKKYSKTYFPFILRQREGLDNSLGVVKFIFPSKYGIYLHETNTRNLFKKDYRALSHGCIRVEQAVNLAFQLSIPDSTKYPVDSIQYWLDTKTKKQLNLSEKIPVYIRYNLCGVKEGKLYFFEDIYNYFDININLNTSL